MKVTLIIVLSSLFNNQTVVHTHDFEGYYAMTNCMAERHKLQKVWDVIYSECKYGQNTETE